MMKNYFNNNRELEALHGILRISRSIENPNQGGSGFM
jgi:hypothetical protein